MDQIVYGAELHILFQKKILYLIEYFFRYRDKMDLKNFGDILNKEVILAKIWWLFFKKGMFHIELFFARS